MKYIVYHADCPDGFCSAALASLAYPEAMTVAMTHEDRTPEFEPGDEVFIVDFRLPLDDVRKFRDRGVIFEIFDHHKSNIEDHLKLGHAELDQLYRRCVLDSSKSGAGLVHAHVLPSDFQVTDLWKYVQDRDLWKFELPMSKEINAGVGALLPLSGPRLMQGPGQGPVEAWRNALLGSVTMNELRVAGDIALKLQASRIAKMMTRAYYMKGWVFQGTPYSLVVANVTSDVSEFGNDALAAFPGADFSATYFDSIEDGHRVWSLRGRPGSAIDLTVLAKHFDGGGHRYAAGFRTGLSENPFINI